MFEIYNQKYPTSDYTYRELHEHLWGLVQEKFLKYLYEYPVQTLKEMAVTEMVNDGMLTRLPLCCCFLCDCHKKNFHRMGECESCPLRYLCGSDCSTDNLYTELTDNFDELIPDEVENFIASIKNVFEFAEEKAKKNGDC